MARHKPHLHLAGPWEADTIDLSPAVYRHLEKVLRIAGPAEVTYTDGSGVVGAGTLESSSVVRGAEHRVERPSNLVVAVAPPKNNARLRFVVEKLAEIGVARLVWLRTEYSEGRAPRTEKASAWAGAALEQSRGAWLMECAEQILLAEVGSLGTPVFATQDGAAVHELPSPAAAVLCVGPEGGFAPGEVPGDAQRLSLGSTVLRIETAAVVGASLLTNRTR